MQSNFVGLCDFRGWICPHPRVFGVLGVLGGFTRFITGAALMILRHRMGEVPLCLQFSMDE